jgi:hypothetical protein
MGWGVRRGGPGMKMRVMVIINHDRDSALSLEDVQSVHHENSRL